MLIFPDHSSLPALLSSHHHSCSQSHSCSWGWLLELWWVSAGMVPSGHVQLCQAGRSSFKQKGNFYTQAVHSLNRAEDSVLTHLMNLGDTSVKMEGCVAWVVVFCCCPLWVWADLGGMSLCLSRGGGSYVCVLFGVWLGSLEAVMSSAARTGCQSSSAVALQPVASKIRRSLEQYVQLMKKLQCQEWPETPCGSLVSQHSHRREGSQEFFTKN